MEGTVDLVVALGPVACGPLAEVLMPYSREGPLAFLKKLKET